MGAYQRKNTGKYTRDPVTGKYLRSPGPDPCPNCGCKKDCCECGSCRFSHASRLRVYGVIEYCPLDVCPGGAYIGGANRQEFEAYLDFVECGTEATRWQGSTTQWTVTQYLGGGCPPTTLFDTTTAANPYANLAYDCATNEWYDADAPTTRWSGDCRGFVIENWQANTPVGCNGNLNYTQNYLRIEVVDNEDCETAPCIACASDITVSLSVVGGVDCACIVELNGQNVDLTHQDEGVSNDNEGGCAWTGILDAPGGGRFSVIIDYDAVRNLWRVYVTPASGTICEASFDTGWQAGLFACVGGVLTGSASKSANSGFPPGPNNLCTVTVTA